MVAGGGSGRRRRRRVVHSPAHIGQQPPIIVNLVGFVWSDCRVSALGCLFCPAPPLCLQAYITIRSHHPPPSIVAAGGVSAAAPLRPSCRHRVTTDRPPPTLRSHVMPWLLYVLRSLETATDQTYPFPLSLPALGFPRMSPRVLLQHHQSPSHHPSTLHSPLHHPSPSSGRPPAHRRLAPTVRASLACLLCP